MFLAPWFLLGLLTVAIPVIIHLRRSTRTQRIIFSTTRFFDEQFVRSARKARLQDLLLMMLRMALLALFVLALSQPLLRLPGLSGLARMVEGGRTIVIVLDDSASMGVATASGTLIEQAKAAATSLIDGLSPAAGDRVAVVLAGRRQPGPQLLLAEPTPDMEVARQAIAQVRVTDLAGDLVAAVKRAGELLGTGKAGRATGREEVYVFSDMQASALGGEAALTAGPGVPLFLVSLAPSRAQDAANISVDSIAAGASRPLVNVPFHVRALLQNHGPALVPAQVRLVLDDQVVGSEWVELLPRRGRVVHFSSRLPQGGWHRGRIEVSAEGADALAADSQRYFVVNVSDALTVAAVNGSPSEIASADELFFFNLALAAGAGHGPADPAAPERAAITVKPLSMADLISQPIASPLVVLANVAEVSPEAATALERYVDQGGSVLMTLGDRTQAAAWNHMVGGGRLHGGLLPGSIGTRRGIPGGADSGTTMAAVASDHPALGGFSGQGLGGLSSAHIDGWWELDVPPESVLLAAADGSPLLVEKRFGRGRVMVLATTIDRDWTNLPLVPAYVALVYRLTTYLALPGLDGGGFAQTGELVALPASATQAQITQVITPQGRIIYPQVYQPTADAAPATVLEDVSDAGVYQIKPAAATGDTLPTALFAANIPADEAQTLYADRQSITPYVAPDASWVFLEDARRVAEQAQVARRGVGLWNQLLVLALLVGLFEPWLANRFSRRRLGSAPIGSSAGSASGSPAMAA